MQIVFHSVKQFLQFWYIRFDAFGLAQQRNSDWRLRNINDPAKPRSARSPTHRKAKEIRARKESLW